MIKCFSFKDIREYLEKRKADDYINVLDKLASVAILFAPVIFGYQFLKILSLLEVKNEVSSIVKKMFDFVSSQQESSHIERIEKIKIAYALVCITSYFEAIEVSLPKIMLKKIKKELLTMNQFAQEPIINLNCLTSRDSIDISFDVPYSDHVTSFYEAKENLLQTYENLTKNLLKMILQSGIQANPEFSSERIEKIVSKIPKKAISIYEAQYIDLANKFQDFALFAQYKEFRSLQKYSQYHSDKLDQIQKISKKLDVGLENLQSFFSSFDISHLTNQSEEILCDLRKVYQSAIEEPIIDDKEITTSNDESRLTFPKIVDAFIPQSYKCIVYQSKDIRLENESTWNQLDEHNDLNLFFVKYLFSTNSIDCPLIILGHPGSGKSLLTKVLSAQLMNSSYTVIRVPLRDVNADAQIDVLVEEQIKKATNRSLPNGYGDFAKQFSQKPLIIILDGYDELLQAKGDVFSGYLEKVRSFQRDQKQLERPVRIIVTSRITLIDKAIVPTGSTILRLLEFNNDQRKRWIEIWNNTNSSFFHSQSSKIKPFSLSENKDNDNLLDLAKQPLLLLMLALYDSEDNSLVSLKDSIVRTQLYDNLLRRFVRRERGRYVPDFSNLKPEEQESHIENAMQKLGIVAIGMYNRRKLFIHSKELETDLKFFELNREDSSYKSHTLLGSESLLASFFFIHESKAQDVSAKSDNSDSAFEFLHNTFGEFLTADFILRYTVQEVNTVNDFMKKNYLTHELEKKLTNPDGLCKEWLACLMFTPLYSRPVILEMIQEHSKCAMNRKGIDLDSFSESFKYIVQNQLKVMLNTKLFPRVMLQENDLPRSIPLLGCISTYTMNLIILASILCPEGFDFIESDYKQTKHTTSETKPWEKLSYLWRTWFSSEDLTGLSSILRAERKDESTISIRCNEKFEATSYDQPIDIILCVSSALANNLLTGLSGLHTERFSEITNMQEQEIASFLAKENHDLHVSYMIATLRKQINCTEIDYIKVNDLLSRLFEVICKVTNLYTLLTLLELIESIIDRKILFLDLYDKLYEVVIKFIFNYIELDYNYDLAFSSAKRIIFRIQKTYRNQRVGFLHTSVDYGLYTNSFVIDNGIGKSISFLSCESLESFVSQLEIFCVSPIDTKHILSLIRDERLMGKQLSSKQTIELLIRRNPNLALNVYFALWKADTNHEFIRKQTYVTFLDISISQLKCIGYEKFGNNALFKALQISHYLDSKKSIQKIENILKQQIKLNHPQDDWSFIYSSPSLAAGLTELIPQLFFKPTATIDKHSFRYHVSGILKLEGFFDILKVTRFLKNKYYDLEIETPLISIYKDVVKRIDCEVLKKCSYDQLRILQWASGIFGDTIVTNMIVSIIEDET